MKRADKPRQSVKNPTVAQIDYCATWTMLKINKWLTVAYNGDITKITTTRNNTLISRTEKTAELFVRGESNTIDS